MSTRSATAREQTLVLGTGATGQSIARWLQRQGRSARFADTRANVDERAIRAVLPGATVERQATSRVLDGAAEVFVSPGIPDHDPLVVETRARGIPLLSDIALFAAHAQAPVVAVTGTNGKSTVVSLLAHMCEHAGIVFAAGGNLGTPALDLPLLDDEGIYLLELSSFQLARTPNLVAQCACVLNIEPDHLDWHGNFAAYRDAKLSIYRNCAYAVLPASADWSDRLVDEDAVRLRFGSQPPVGSRDVGISEIDGKRYWMAGEQRLLAVDEAALVGEHNLLNIAAAFAIGSSIDLPLSAMIAAVRGFPGLDHRHQLVAVVDGIRFVDDSKATNCAAALTSAAAVAGPVVLLAGGLGKGEDYDAFAQSLPAAVRMVVAYGQIAETLAAALRRQEIQVEQVADLQAAVHAAHAHAQTGDTVLLAPAAASQDAYQDYRERGRHFRQLVGEVTS